MRRRLMPAAFCLVVLIVVAFGQISTYPPQSGGGGGGNASVPGAGMVKSNGTVLQTAVSGTDYAAPSALRRVTAATDTATSTDGAIVCSATSNSVVETLPPTPAASQKLEFKRVDSTAGNTCTLTANSGQNIEGGATAGSLNVPSGTAYTLRWESSTSTWWLF